VRRYHTIVYKDAKLRVACPRTDLVERELRAQREALEAYIRRQPEFETALEPIDLIEDAPEIVRRMEAASRRTGVGPMAAVAGAMAETCARAALAAGAREAIVENGGDLYASSPEPVLVGVYAGSSPLSGHLAFRLPPEQMPLSLCSSSSTMGHSLSFGDCDLATVAARDAALADAAATLACNSVHSAADLEPVLEALSRIPGVLGLLLVKGEALAFCGELPPLVRADPDDTARRVTRF
jgi:ApbE superfamily uncharacterized protein (UPF0280 family)